MLTIIIPEIEFFDETRQEFSSESQLVLELEHSLVSLSKWESKFEKPFLDTKEKTDEESLYYIKCMILTPDYPENIFDRFTPEHFQDINTYIEAKMTATTFREDRKDKANREVVTSELIYYWMVTFNVPIECQYWHLNRLFTLIRVFSVKNSKPEKVSKRELLARNRELNAKRKAELGTTG